MADEVKIASLCLRDEQSVKRIAVVSGQGGKSKYIRSRYGQDDKSIPVLLLLQYVCERKAEREFPKLHLDLKFPYAHQAEMQRICGRITRFQHGCR